MDDDDDDEGASRVQRVAHHLARIPHTVFPHAAPAPAAPTSHVRRRAQCRSTTSLLMYACLGSGAHVAGGMSDFNSLDEHGGAVSLRGDNSKWSNSPSSDSKRGLPHVESHPRPDSDGKAMLARNGTVKLPLIARQERKTVVSTRQNSRRGLLE